MEGIYGTERGMSLVRNRHQPYWAASSFEIQKLNELHKYGWDAVLARAVPNQPYRGGRQIYRRPTNREVAKFVGRGMLRKLVRRVQWSTAMVIGKLLSDKVVIFSRPRRRPRTSKGSVGSSPPGHFYADPFLIEHASKRWVGKRCGTLACGELTPQGELVDVRPILELPYHLSYPMVFEDGGQFWMIPKSYAGGAIELYQASDFPYGWQRERVLYPAPAVDTTVWKQDGLFWFFTTFLEPNGLGASCCFTQNP